MCSSAAKNIAVCAVLKPRMLQHSCHRRSPNIDTLTCACPLGTAPSGRIVRPHGAERAWNVELIVSNVLAQQCGAKVRAGNAAHHRLQAPTPKFYWTPPEWKDRDWRLQGAELRRGTSKFWNNVGVEDSRICGLWLKRGPESLSPAPPKATSVSA